MQIPEDDIMSQQIAKATGLEPIYSASEICVLTGLGTSYIIGKIKLAKVHIVTEIFSKFG